MRPSAQAVPWLGGQLKVIVVAGAPLLPSCPFPLARLRVVPFEDMHSLFLGLVITRKSTHDYK